MGVDCCGLILAVAKELGIPLVDKHDFRVFRKTPPDDIWLTNYLDQQCEPGNGSPGNVLVFWINSKTRRPQHLGIATDIGVIHSYTRAKVVEHSLNPLWKSMLVCSYKLPGVE